jgi:hypothetical protein
LFDVGLGSSSLSFGFANRASKQVALALVSKQVALVSKQVVLVSKQVVLVSKQVVLALASNVHNRMSGISNNDVETGQFRTSRDRYIPKPTFQILGNLGKHSKHSLFYLAGRWLAACRFAILHNFFPRHRGAT